MFPSHDPEQRAYEKLFLGFSKNLTPETRDQVFRELEIARDQYEQLESFYSYFDIAPFAWVSIGMCHDDVLKLEKLSDSLGYTPNICIDIANGYTDRFVSFCKSVRTKFGKESIIMAGNVCTPEMVQELIIHGGVDIVKVGKILKTERARW